ncbi:MAG: D-alanyl-D-alanine carboxypeptidase, partial [Phycisphaeraceae bacterium]|nr:D-alanyl-D-alanine carboxypeptidase [Phycisphaeraceae bacterium]
CNKDSQNLFAEALAKRLAHEATGRPGSWTDASQVIENAIQQRVGSDDRDLVVADGSGMSRRNQVSAQLLVDLLASMARDKEVGPMFLESLSVSGRDGTLRRRFGEALEGRVIGKTGYIREVSTFSGVILDDRGRPAIAFSLLFNDIRHPVSVHKIKRLQDRVVEALAARVNPPVAAAAAR